MVKYVVTLTEEERDELLNIIDRGKGSASRIKRANILLAVDRGEGARLRMTDEQASKVYHSTAKTVYSLKKSFVEEGFDHVLERKVRKTPPKIKIDGEAEAKIIALTCTDPPDGYASWSLRLIADKVVELAILPSISHTAIGDLLKKTKLSHGYTRNGASPNNPENS